MQENYLYYPDDQDKNPNKKNSFNRLIKPNKVSHQQLSAKENQVIYSFLRKHDKKVRGLKKPHNNKTVN